MPMPSKISLVSVNYELTFELENRFRGPHLLEFSPGLPSVNSESRPVVSEQSVNGRRGPETDNGTTNLSIL